MKMEVFIVFLSMVVLCGCHIYTMRTNTKSPDMGGVSTIGLDITKTVTLVNTLIDAGDEQIGAWTGWKDKANFFL